MKRICWILISLFAMMTSSVSAQSLDWVKSIGGVGDDGAYDIVTDLSLNVYVVGWFSSTVDFDPGASVYSVTSAGDRDIFVLKLNAQGQLVWVRTMGGTGQDEGNVITRDSSGNIIVAGRFSDNFDFNTGPGSTVLTSNGDRDIYIAKFDTSGNFIWAESFGGNTYDDAERIRTDSDGNIFITGSFTSTVDFDPGNGQNLIASHGSDDIYLAKYNSNGAFMWARGMGGTASDDGVGMIIDENDNVVLSGYFSGVCNFGSTLNPVVEISNGGSDIFFAKYSPMGSLIVENAIGGLGNDACFDIQFANEKYYVTGYFSNSVDFDPSVNAHVLNALGDVDLFIAAYDTSSNYLWSNSAGSTNFDFGSAISVLPSGNLFLHGYYTGTMNFVMPSGNSALPSAGGYDIFTSMIDSTGAFMNAQKIGGGGLEQSRFQTVDNLGAIYLPGILGSSNVDYDFDSLVVAPIYHGSNDVFVAKYEVCDSLIISPLIGNSVACEGDLLLFNAQSSIDVANYNWSFPADWNLIFQNSGQFVVSVGNQSGIVSLTAHSICGMTQQFTKNVQVNQRVIDTLFVAACEGENYIFPDGSAHVLWNDTVQTSMLSTIHGCDSIITSNITVNHYQIIQNPVALCSGNSYAINGHTYSVSGLYIDTLVVANTCDSIVMTNISILPVNLSLNPQVICSNSFYSINNNIYNQAGVYLDTLQNVYGCDSIVITNLLVNTVDTSISLIAGGFLANQPNATYQWCECTINGPLPIPGKTSQTFLPDFLGTYSVIITYNNCTDTSGCFNATMVGLTSITSSASCSATLDQEHNNLFIKSSSNIKSVELLDLAGRVVQRSLADALEIKISVADLSKGLYLLSVNNGIQSSTIKILIP